MYIVQCCSLSSKHSNLKLNGNMEYTRIMIFTKIYECGNDALWKIWDTSIHAKHAYIHEGF